MKNIELQNEQNFEQPLNNSQKKFENTLTNSRANHINSNDNSSNFGIEIGDLFDLSELYLTQKFTQPPSRFSAATLIKKLEEEGIGRPSTYASIITTLVDRGYSEMNKNIMIPTTLGLRINQILTDNFEQITSSNLTAQMEENLDQISRGNKNYNETLGEFWTPFKSLVESKSLELTGRKDDYRTTETDELCPKCGSEMTLKIGRFGEYFQCLETREHQFAKNYKEYEAAVSTAYQKFHTQTFGQKCAVCAKDLIVRVSKASLKPYLACPEYKVGNNHTVMEVNYGNCPECVASGRAGVLVMKKAKKFGKPFLACNLPIKECGFIQKSEAKSEIES